MAQSDQVDTKVELKREMGFAGAVSIVIGSTIGSGIFISPVGVLRYSGSVGMCLSMWLLVGIVTIFASLCFSELGTSIHKSGGMYTYIRMGVGNPLAFCYIVQGMLFTTPGSLVVILRTCAKYLVTLFPLCGSPALLEKSITLAIIVGLFLVNMYSSTLAARVMIFTTNAKVIALVVIIIGGIVSMAKGTTSELDAGFSGTTMDPTSLIMAYFACSWAFSGGENVTNVVEEIKNPAKTIPRALIIGIIIVIVVYLLTNISYLAVLDVDEMLSGDATAVMWGHKVLGPAVVLIPLSVAISTLGTGSTGYFSSTRVIYTAARDHNIPDVVSYIHMNKLTPLVATTLTMCMAIVLVMPADVGDLINYLEFLGAFFKGCVYVSMLRFRYQYRNVERPIKVHLVIPVFLLLLQAYLFVTPLILDPQLEFLWAAIGVFGSSGILYVIFVRFRYSLPYTDELVTWIQLTLQVAPPPEFTDDILFKTKGGDSDVEEEKKIPEVQQVVASKTS